MVKHMHSVRKSLGALCHHPLVKGHIKPGGKICKRRGKTPRRRLVLGGALLHLRFYFGKLGCVQMGTSNE